MQALIYQFGHYNVCDAMAGGTAAGVAALFLVSLALIGAGARLMAHRKHL